MEDINEIVCYLIVKKELGLAKFEHKFKTTKKNNIIKNKISTFLSYELGTKKIKNSGLVNLIYNPNDKNMLYEYLKNGMVTSFMKKENMEKIIGNATTPDGYIMYHVDFITKKIIPLSERKYVKHVNKKYFTYDPKNTKINKCDCVLCNNKFGENIKLMIASQINIFNNLSKIKTYFDIVKVLYINGWIEYKFNIIPYNIKFIKQILKRYIFNINIENISESYCEIIKLLCDNILNDKTVKDKELINYAKIINRIDINNIVIKNDEQLNLYLKYLQNNITLEDYINNINIKYLDCSPDIHMKIHKMEFKYLKHNEFKYIFTENVMFEKKSILVNDFIQCYSYIDHINDMYYKYIVDYSPSIFKWFKSTNVSIYHSYFTFLTRTGFKKEEAESLFVWNDKAFIKYVLEYSDTFDKKIYDKMNSIDENAAYKYITKHSIDIILPLKKLENFICPISSDVMRFPVIAADGFRYERCHITEYLKKQNISPYTREKLEHTNVCFDRNASQTIKNILIEEGFSESDLLVFYAEYERKTNSAIPKKISSTINDSDSDSY